MHNPFEFTDEEKAATTGQEQLAMLNRLVDFVNERLAEIESLQTDVEQAKDDIETIKNPSK
jgi:prefoldin subunit 5